MTVVISKGLSAEPCSAVIVRHEDGVAYLPRTSWSSWIQLTRQAVQSCGVGIPGLSYCPKWCTCSVPSCGVHRITTTVVIQAEPLTPVCRQVLVKTVASVEFYMTVNILPDKIISVIYTG